MKTSSRFVPIVIVVAVLAACSSGDDASSSAGQAADGSTASAGFTRSEFSDGSEPWLVELTEPTGPLLDTWIDRAVIEPVPSDPPIDIESQLTWIYEDLIELWRDSQIWHRSEWVMPQSTRPTSS